MGNTLSTKLPTRIKSFVPAWLRGQHAEEKRDPVVELEDDTTAGIEASTAVEAIAAGHKAWITAYDMRNFAGIAKLYTRDCKICPSGTRTAYGRQESAIGWESLTTTGVDRVVFSDTTVELLEGDIVSENSRYYLYPKEGQETIDQGHHIMVWKKLQGKWYIHLHIFSSSKKGEKASFDHIAETCFLWEYSYFIRDFPTVASLYTEDCVLCPPAWPQVESRMRVQRFWARFPSMGVDHVERTVVNADDMGPGNVSAEIRYTMYDYRNQAIDMGTSIALYRKEKDGRWGIHSEIFNSDANVNTTIETEEQEVQVVRQVSDPSDVGALDA